MSRMILQTSHTTRPMSVCIYCERTEPRLNTLLSISDREITTSDVRRGIFFTWAGIRGRNSLETTAFGEAHLCTFPKGIEVQRITQPLQIIVSHFDPVPTDIHCTCTLRQPTPANEISHTSRYISLQSVQR